MHRDALEKAEDRHLKKIAETIRLAERNRTYRELAKALAFSIRKGMQRKQQIAELFPGEVSRRYDCIKKSFILDCIQIVNEIFEGLNIPISTNNLASEVMKVIRLKVIVMPDIGLSQCVNVQRCVAMQIMKFLDFMKDEQSGSTEIQTSSDHLKENSNIGTDQSIEDSSKSQISNEAKPVEVRASTSIVRVRSYIYQLILSNALIDSSFALRNLAFRFR